MSAADDKEAGDKEWRLPTHFPSHLHFIAYSGACGKAWVMSYNRQPRPETSRNLWTWEERQRLCCQRGQGSVSRMGSMR
jgi:hypothetical protein